LIPFSVLLLVKVCAIVGVHRPVVREIEPPHILGDEQVGHLLNLVVEQMLK
jgi:hypothetical protein